MSRSIQSESLETRKTVGAGPITVALAGNPNSGKTSIFNNLTGAHQHVGNYPGVTVEYKEGTCRFGGETIRVVDLPGTYSLTAYSEEEVIARNYVLERSPDVVIDIIDASNLERNLYLAVQLMELGVPLVLALNMHDVAEKRGTRIDVARLGKLLKVPVVPTVGHRNAGTPELLETAVRVAEDPRLGAGVAISYGRELDEEVARLSGLLGECAGRYPTRWVALKLLENDPEVERHVRGLGGASPEVLKQLQASTHHLRSVFGEDPEIVIADARYGFIAGAVRETLTTTAQGRRTASDRIDAVLTNRILAFPIFLGLMWLVFQTTFTIGDIPMRVIQALFVRLGEGLTIILPEGFVRSLLVDGVVAGVGGVVVFLPNILFLFLAIAVLEDSGYMARVAFIMDRLMHRVGLHGKSFIPMLLGFGCTVPAVMATRTLESKRDRIITTLITPLMSCGARLPVYVLLAGTFFSEKDAGVVIFSIYLLGIVLAILMAKVFGKWLLPGMSAPFVMELPPYRMPTLKGLMIHMWERGWLYLKKAGTVILAFSVLIWFLSTFPQQSKLQREYAVRIAEASPDRARALENELARKKLEGSFAGSIGQGLSVVLRPVGLGDWKIGTALFAGFGAKEMVVSSMGTLYSLGHDREDAPDLKAALRKDRFFSPLVAYVFMVFVLVYVPCLASVAVVGRETRSWQWPLFLIAYTCVLAWVAAGVVYWSGRLLGLGV